MDVDKLQAALFALQHRTVMLQTRLHSWTVTTEEDKDAVRDDVRRLKGYMNDVCQEVGL
jgi:hypothetical protein